ncbi:MAG: Fur family transcriptional regulator [Thermodesulfobacteriota bacterium]
MCRNCDYQEMLSSRGLEPTPNRLRVLEILGKQETPLGAQAITAGLRKNSAINRVTVYRILDLLVEKGLVLRLGGTSRGLVFGLAPNENHPAHPHFQCQSCGVLHCLEPLRSQVDLQEIKGSFPGEIREVEVLVSGICANCLRK